MTDLNVTPPPKRLHILDDEEIEALYGKPCLSGDDRTNVFTLTQPEKDLLASFTHLSLQLYFLLQLGYFKAKQLFFTFTFGDVIEDVTYLLASYFPQTPQPDLRMPNKRTILKQRHQILKLFSYRLCTPTDRQNLWLHAQHAARISSKPIYILRELLRSLAEQRIVKPGYTFLQEELVGKAITAEGKRLTTTLHTLLSDSEHLALDTLLQETSAPRNPEGGQCVHQQCHRCAVGVSAL
ncbi:MAG TPA: DUF4158 domain-containing protein [Ktedonobacteraceae bacterium]|nr:DUF4158 domain-containing protein [Ktedonobacteraceae bacterium]